MRRDRKSVVKRERTIMIVSSLLVLTAMTATGVYVNNRNKENTDGYVVDFSKLEEEVADNRTTEETKALENSDDLDYDPSFRETQSSNVENPGLQTENSVSDNSVSGEEAKKTEEDQLGEESDERKAGGEAGQDVTQEARRNKDKKVEDPENREEQESSQDADAADEAALSQDAALSADGNDETAADTVSAESADSQETTVEASSQETLQPALSFSEEDGLLWPAVGDVLIAYSMDQTVYFATLDQYKYNPAIIIGLKEGTDVAATANGRVTSVYTDSEIGQALVMDLGDGYEVTYGQLKDLTVNKGEYVTAGTIVGKVAVPTKYYNVEGSNLYFKLTKDGTPVNPMNRLRHQ